MNEMNEMNEMIEMIEYVGKDAKEIGEALKTLILKCTNNESDVLDCIITFGEFALDCHFEFKPHRYDE